MKTSEFIKQFNKLDTVYDIRAIREKTFLHEVLINKFINTKYETIARLPENSNDWNFCGNFYFSPEMLELMAELAKTPPEEREDERFVILNSKIRQQHWEYIKICNDNQYFILRNTSDPEILTMESYTIEELEDQKKWLPVKWRNAIDSMLTPLDVALEMGKRNKHEDLD